MATLSVLKFNDPYGAERVMIALQGMQEREMITLEDAAVVSWPQGNRKPTTHQLHSTAGAGAGWGAFWGFLFGLIFFVPFLGAAIGARRPLPNATALAFGYFATCAAIGIARLTLFDGAAGAGGAASTAGRVISASVGGLLIVLGLRSLLNTAGHYAQPPMWMGSITSMSPAKAFALGMALFPVQIKNLAIFVVCVNLIGTASLGPRASTVALGLVLLVFAIPVLVLIGLYAAVPQRASNMLGSLRAWMEKNNRAITVVLCFVFGAFFLVRGLSGP